MIELTKDVLASMQKFREKFGDIVPIREIPGNVTSLELVEAINKSLKAGKNLLPVILGYGKVETDKNKDI